MQVPCQLSSPRFDLPTSTVLAPDCEFFAFPLSLLRTAVMAVAYSDKLGS